jgi:hypothetical protein
MRTFTVTQFTEINVNGQKATIADLKTRMTANVTMGTDPSRASESMPKALPGKETGKTSKEEGRISDHRVTTNERQ